MLYKARYNNVESEGGRLRAEPTKELFLDMWEEMVKDQETTAEQALEEEARRHREAYSKLERERSTEIELLTTRWVPLMPKVQWGK